MSRHSRITRRIALHRMTAAAASMSLFPALVRGQERKSAPVESPATVCGAVTATESNGVEIHQVTIARLPHSNIYCEVPYCSADSRYFVYQQACRRSANPIEFMVVELGTWKEHRLDEAATRSGCAITPDGTFYYLKREGSELALMRANLSQGKPEAIYRRKDTPWVRSLGTVTSDGRYFAGGVRIEGPEQMFGVMLLDLRTGQETIIDRDPYILNSHPQFDPGQGRWLMIQHNRGGKVAPDGTIERLTGPEGATLYNLSVPDGKRTELKVGLPHTTRCTGHEAWIGPTGEMLLSVSPKDDFTPEKGNLLAITPGGSPRVVTPGYAFNHVGATRCGRLYSGDDSRGDFNVVVGSPKTGRSVVVCASKTSPTKDQSTHAHPYLTPDLKWVIFNSNRAGWPQVYAARIPEEIIRGVLPA